MGARERKKRWRHPVHNIDFNTRVEKEEEEVEGATRLQQFWACWNNICCLFVLRAEDARENKSSLSLYLSLPSRLLFSGVSFFFYFFVQNKKEKEKRSPEWIRGKSVAFLRSLHKASLITIHLKISKTHSRRKKQTVFLSIRNRYPFFVLSTWSWFFYLRRRHSLITIEVIGWLEAERQTLFVWWLTRSRAKWKWGGP